MTTETGGSAYELLTKPTLELTDAEVKIVVEDLRQRRLAYLKTGKPDKPSKPVVKAEATQDILGDLGLG